MKYDVFISYSRKDSVVADEICEVFDKCGITYFIDRRDIAGGMEFPEEIAQAILNAEAILFLCSRNAYQSKFTVNEIVFAMNEKSDHCVIPYLLDGSVLPLFLRMRLGKSDVYDCNEVPVFPGLVDIVRWRTGKSALNHTASLLDLSAPENVTLKGHSDWVLDLAFSPDGSTLVSCGCDGRFILWDMETLTFSRAVDSGAKTVCAVRFAPDGKTLFTAQHNQWQEGWLGKWDAASGNAIVAAIPLNMDCCRKLVLSGDGQRLIAAYQKVGVFDTVTMEQVARYKVSDYSQSLVYGLVALDPGARHLLAGGDALPLTEVDLDTGAIRPMPRNVMLGGIENMAVSDDGSQIAVAAGEYISVFNRGCFDVAMKRFAYRSRDMESVALNSDGSILAGGTKQGDLVIWDIQTGRELYHNKFSEHQLINVTFSPDSRAIACCGEDGDVWLIRFPARR